MNNFFSVVNKLNMNIEICLFFIVSTWTWVLAAGSILIGQHSAVPLVCYLTYIKTMTLTHTHTYTHTHTRTTAQVSTPPLPQLLLGRKGVEFTDPADGKVPLL